VALTGQCAAREVDGKLTPTDCSHLVRIKAVYKGLAPGDTITIRENRVDPLRGTSMSDGHEYLLFLRKEEGKSHLGLVETPGAIVPLEGLAYTGESRSGMEGFQLDTLDAAREPGHLAAALSIVLQCDHVGTSALERVQEARVGNTEENLLKLAILSRSAPSRYLTELADALAAWIEANPVSGQAPPTLVPPGMLIIGETLASLTSTAEIPTLERIAQSNQPFLCASAMQGIRRLKDPGSVPFLVSQLDSADRSVRYLAVITLAEISGKSGEFGPGKLMFDKDEKSHIELWKNWWNERRKDKN
jgi:hypothetical protein